MRNKVSLSPPPSLIPTDLPSAWLLWFEQLSTRVGSGPLKVAGYSRTALPPATAWGSLVAGQEYSSTIFVHNANQGPSVAFSDGTNWISSIDGLTV